MQITNAIFEENPTIAPPTIGTDDQCASAQSQYLLRLNAFSSLARVATRS